MEIPVRVKVYRSRRDGRIFLKIPKEMSPVIGDRKEILIKIIVEDEKE